MSSCSEFALIHFFCVNIFIMGGKLHAEKGILLMCKLAFVDYVFRIVLYGEY